MKRSSTGGPRVRIAAGLGGVAALGLLAIAALAAKAHPAPAAQPVAEQIDRGRPDSDPAIHAGERNARDLVRGPCRSHDFPVHDLRCGIAE